MRTMLYATALLVACGDDDAPIDATDVATTDAATTDAATTDAATTDAATTDDATTDATPADTADVAPPTATLTIVVEGPGAATSIAAKVDDGPAVCTPRGCTLEVPIGAEVELTVTPDSLSRIEGWTNVACVGASCTTTVIADRTVTFRLVGGRVLAIASWTGTSGPSAAAVDDAGNGYVVGSFSDTIDFGAGALTSAADVDRFHASYDAAGALRWGVASGALYNEHSDEVVYDAAVDELLVATNANGINDFGGNIVGPGLLLVRYAAETGAPVGVMTACSGQDHYAYGLDQSGDQVAVGVRPARGLPYECGPAQSTPAADESLIVAFDGSRALSWVVRLASTGGVYITDVAFDSAGGVIATGLFLGVYEGVDAGAGPRTFVGRWEKDPEADRLGRRSWLVTFASTSFTPSMTASSGREGVLVFATNGEASATFGEDTIDELVSFIVAISREGVALWADEVPNVGMPSGLATLEGGALARDSLFAAGALGSAAFDLDYESGLTLRWERYDVASYCGAVTRGGVDRVFMCPSNAVALDGITPSGNVNGLVTLSP